MEYRLKIKNEEIVLDSWPSECPFCHKHIEPLLLFNDLDRQYLELVFKCPSNYCNRLFIHRYRTHNDYSFFLDSTTIGSIKEVTFSEEIRSISPSFTQIFNQAHFAEQHKLLEICGVGYRKALEFLIKDFLIKKDSSKAEVIKKKALGKCIQEDVSDTKIKSAAQRAVWLGNDETHYVKKWTEENLESLKKLINLTYHWIEMEELAKEFEEKMPNQK
ncbi:MAG: DUF4145 domain-containing protein [Gammaproteobacteria bacterium]|nr:MAG: DUF4145 domain-containing protein [Gammaproteobacteria bacterium]